MNANRTLVTFMFLCGISPTLRADVVLATGGVYGGPTQHKAYCYVFNAQPIRSVNIAAAEIIDQNGSSLPIPQEGNTCTNWRTPVKALPAGQTCVLGAEIANNSTHACRVVVKGKKLKLRGTMDIRDVNDIVLTSSELR